MSKYHHDINKRKGTNWPFRWYWTVRRDEADDRTEIAHGWTFTLAGANRAVFRSELRDHKNRNK